MQILSPDRVERPAAVGEGLDHRREVAVIIVDARVRPSSALLENETQAVCRDRPGRAANPSAPPSSGLKASWSQMS